MQALHCPPDVSKLSSSCAEILKALGAVPQKSDVSDGKVFVYLLFINLFWILPIRLLLLIFTGFAPCYCQDYHRMCPPSHGELYSTGRQGGVISTCGLWAQE